MNCMQFNQTDQQVKLDFKDVSYFTSTVDSELSATSENPVQNKVIKSAFDELSESKVSLPKDNTGATQSGTDGQILQTNGDGTTQWVDKPTGVTSWNDLKDKPFGEEKTVVTILPECQGVYMEASKMFYLPGPELFSLEAGKEYTVNWNGAKYTCVAEDLGDSIALRDVDVPFIFVAMPSDVAESTGYVAAAQASEGVTALTISVGYEVETVKQIPVKYLPVVQVVHDSTTGETTCSVSYSELLAMLQTGSIAGVSIVDVVSGTGEIEISFGSVYKYGDSDYIEIHTASNPLFVYYADGTLEYSSGEK